MKGYDFWDLLIVLGFGLICWAIYEIYMPLGHISLGAVLSFVGVRMGSRTVVTGKKAGGR